MNSREGPDSAAGGRPEPFGKNGDQNDLIDDSDDQVTFKTQRSPVGAFGDDTSIKFMSPHPSPDKPDKLDVEPDLTLYSLEPLLRFHGVMYYVTLNKNVPELVSEKEILQRGGTERRSLETYDPHNVSVGQDAEAIKTLIEEKVTVLGKMNDAFSKTRELELQLSAEQCRRGALEDELQQFGRVSLELHDTEQRLRTEQMVREELEDEVIDLRNKIRSHSTPKLKHPIIPYDSPEGPKIVKSPPLHKVVTHSTPQSPEDAAGEPQVKHVTFEEYLRKEKQPSVPPIAYRPRCRIAEVEDPSDKENTDPKVEVSSPSREPLRTLYQVTKEQDIPAYVYTPRVTYSSPANTEVTWCGPRLAIEGPTMDDTPSGRDYGGGETDRSRSRYRSTGRYRERSHSGSPERKLRMKPATYDGRGELCEYLSHFRIAIKTNQWDYDESGMKLAGSLRGEALSIMSSLSDEEATDYEALVLALKDRFDPEGQVAIYKAELTTRVCRKGESVNEYGWALKKLAQRAHPGERFPASVLVQMYINGLPSVDMKRQVTMSNPRNIEAAMAIAKSYESFDDINKGERTVRKPKNDSESHKIHQVASQEASKNKQSTETKTPGGDAVAQEVQKTLNQFKAELQQMIPSTVNRKPLQSYDQNTWGKMIRGPPNKSPRQSSPNSMGRPWGALRRSPAPPNYGNWNRDRRTTWVPPPGNKPAARTWTPGCFHCGSDTHGIKNCPEAQKARNPSGSGNLNH